MAAGSECHRRGRSRMVEEAREAMNVLKQRDGASSSPHASEALTRARFVQWIVKLCRKLSTVSDHALHTAVGLFDRVGPHIRDATTIAATCVFVASKYQDVHSVESSDISSATDFTVSVEDLIRAEPEVLSGVGYRVGFPSAVEYLECLLAADGRGPLTPTHLRALKIGVATERGRVALDLAVHVAAHVAAHVAVKKRRGARRRRNTHGRRVGVTQTAKTARTATCIFSPTGGPARSACPDP